MNCTPEFEQAIADSTLGLGVPDVCDPGSPISAAAAARHELETASAWLRDVGFGGPRVSERDEGAYVARLDNFGVALANACDEERATSSPVKHILRLSPCFHFAFVTPENLGAFHNRGALLGLATAHELFHAVQLGYAKMNTSRFARWIVEGTAQLVEVASARRAGTPRPEPRSILRYYDTALHIPKVTPEVGRDGGEWQIWACGTWFFWDFLGEHLNSPNRIESLDTVFQHQLVDDNNGLSGVGLDVGTLGRFPFGERNRFLGTVPGGSGQALVKVANLPEDIAGVSGGEGLSFGSDIPVEVELDVVQGVVTFSGGVTGSYDVRDRTVFDISLGSGGSCNVNLYLTPDVTSGDSVNLFGRLPAPLGTGRFPIVAGFGEPRLGSVNVTSAPGHERPGRSGFMHPELASGGTFEIVRLTEQFLEGRIRASVPAVGTSAGAHIVDAHFIAQLGGWVGASRREVHPCVPR